MDKITDACKAGFEKVKETVDNVSKGAKEKFVKVTHHGADTQADAAGHKIDETKHACKDECHKQEATR